MKVFEEYMKNAFKETGVAPQYNTPAWKVCEYAYRAGMLRAAEIAEGREGSWADLEWNQAAQDIASAIRKEVDK